VVRTRECGAGLASLREEHLAILAKIRQEEDQEAATQESATHSLLEDRIAAVTDRQEGAIAILFFQTFFCPFQPFLFI
jgi:hypothetical protein